MAVNVAVELKEHSAKRLKMEVNFASLYREEKQLALQVSAVLDLVDNPEHGITVYTRKNDQGVLKVTPDRGGILIDYPTRVGLARGLSHLRDVWQTGRSIEESVQVEDCGIMLDCSRNAVASVPTVQHILDTMAVMGLNCLMLYTEDTYQLPNYPYFGYQRGAYSPQELREIDDYAHFLGIEVIPCIQTLGHLATTLRWPHGKELRDTEDILLAGSDKTYTFIEEMFRVLRENLRSKRMHIGMDETHTLGLGRYLMQNGYVERHVIMQEHLKKVAELAKAYGYSPMMWSDMFFRMASPNHEYAEKASPLTEEVKKAIHPEVSQVYWDYYHHDMDTYDYMLERHMDMGVPEVWFAGGIWTWNGLKVNHGRVFTTSEAAFKACRKHNIQHVVATAWGDNGQETNVLEALIGFQYFGEFAWQKELPSRSEVLRRMAVTTGIDAKAMYAMRLFDEVPGVYTDNPESDNPSKYILWSDPLMGLFDAHILPMGDALAEHYMDLSDYFDECSARTVNQERLFYLQSAQLADVLQRKVRLTQDLRPAYLEDDIESLKRLVKTDLPELIAAMADLQAFTLSIWYLYNKPEGSEVIDSRFGAQLARLRTCQDRLDGYLTGVYDQLPELESERLSFDGRAKAELQDRPHFNVNLWREIASANPL